MAAPIVGPDRCPQRGTWATLMMILCCSVIRLPQSQSAEWCDARWDHTLSHRLGGFIATSCSMKNQSPGYQKIQSFMTIATVFLPGCLPFTFVSLVAQYEAAWWVIITHWLCLKAVGRINKLQMTLLLQLKEKKNNNHGNEDPNYSVCMCVSVHGYTPLCITWLQLMHKHVCTDNSLQCICVFLCKGSYRYADCTDTFSFWNSTE